MKIALAVVLYLAVPPHADEASAGLMPWGRTRYWYGNPLKEGTAAEAQEHYPKAALATLDAKERAALDKLKALGFTVQEFKQFKSTEKDGKRLVTPPRGIALVSPGYRFGGLGPGPTLKDLEPLLALRHVERLDLSGKYVADDTLDLIRNMDELWLLSVSSKRITDAGLKKLSRVKSLRAITIAAANITDAGLGALAACPALERVYLSCTVGVTDAGMVALTGNKKIVFIGLAGSLPGSVAVGDPGVAALADMPNLAVLGMRASRVTDKGLAGMSKPGCFSSLVRLTLSYTAISDAGLKSLENLKAMPALRFLDVERTNVTPAGVVALQKARPGLVIMAMHPNGNPFESTKPRK